MTTRQDLDEAFILTELPIETLGGAERFLRYLAEGLEARGFAVRVFHYKNSAPRWARDWPERSRLLRELALVLKPFFIGRAANRALTARTTLVLSSGSVGSWPAPRGVRRVHYAHGTLQGQAEAIRPFVSRLGYLKMKWWDARVMERSAGRGKLVLCCSEFTEEEVRTLFGYPAQAMWYPLDLEHFRPVDRLAARRELGLDPARPVGIFVGNAHPMKGLGTVEATIRAHPEVQWLVVLRGPVPPEVHAWPSTRVINNATYAQLPAIYAAADVSLCPSVYEPFGYVVAEALACGTPVVATPGGAACAFLHGPVAGDLLVGDARDADAFVHAVSRVLKDPERYRACVESTIRPRLRELMSPERWWPRFLQTVGLQEIAARAPEDAGSKLL